MLYIDVLNVSMRFSIRFCIYAHIINVFLQRFSKMYFSEMTGMQKLFFVVKLLPRHWDVSHRVERQKLMIKSREEMSVRVRKGSFMANLLLHYNFLPTVLFEIL